MNKELLIEKVTHLQPDIPLLKTCNLCHSSCLTLGPKVQVKLKNIDTEDKLEISSVLNHC